MGQQVFFNLSGDKIRTLKIILLDSSLTKNLLLFARRATWARSWLGFLMYCACSLGLSTAWRHLLEDLAWRHWLLKLFCSGPWVWPSLPQQAWVVDATPWTIAGVDQKALPVFCYKLPVQLTIWKAELLALFTLALFAPTNTIICTDSSVVKGMCKHSSIKQPLIVLLSFLCTVKDLKVTWIPTNCNLADFLSHHPRLGVTTPFFALARESIRHLDMVQLEKAPRGGPSKNKCLYCSTATTIKYIHVYE